MRFTTALLSFAATAATASAAAVSRRADYGYWDFEGSCTFPVSGYTSYHVNATYHNSELPNAINVICSYLYSPPTHNVTASCSDPSFTYDFGDVGQAATVSNVTLKQTVGLLGEQVTVIGTKEFHFDFSGGAGFTGTAEGPIPVTSAVA